MNYLWNGYGQMNERDALRHALRMPGAMERMQRLIEASAPFGDLPDDDEVVILAAPEPITDGSRQEQCGSCQSPVWIAVSSQEMIASRPKGSPPVRFICMECFIRTSKEQLAREGGIR